MTVMTLALYAGCFVAGMVLDVAVLRIGAARPMIAVCWYAFWTVTATILAALEAALGSWGWAAWMAFCAVSAGYRCWKFWHRRRRKRAPRAFGAKSRALITRLVARQREAGART